MPLAVTEHSGALAPDASLNIAATHPFTCNTCQVAFRNSDAQRTHMRSDWHRYNLKRRVASLPPLSSEVFTEKVLAAQAANSAAAAKAAFEKACVACQKTFFSENAFLNHMASQKHRSRDAQLRKNGGLQDETASVMSGTFSLGEPINVGEPITASPATSIQESAAEEEFSKIVDAMKDTAISSEDPLLKRPSRPTHSSVVGDRQPSPNGTDTEHDEDYALTHCMFCNHNSASVKLNVLHMRKFHGMFVPEQAYLIDGEGLLKYLFDKITKNNECLYCHKIKTSTPAIQTHMRDKGHCMIAFSTEDEMLEVGQFYDFSSTYSDDEDVDGSTSTTESPTGGAKGDGDDDDEEGWESDSSISSVVGGNAFHTEYELHLPSGRTAGHRSLFKYFRQNLRNYPTPEERLLRQREITDAAQNPDVHDTDASARRNQSLVTRVRGGIGMIGASDSQKRYVKAAEVRERRSEQNARKQYEWGINRRGNFQKHFRDQLLQ
ncbi:zinc finger protein [Histoplasma capsulatum G186AR]|uniref:Zinc finger protein n=2 Tax=Ajellomyces capsulatus TaxID=5037 RepID=C0NS92_AJECG|nr:zinc finger protein [Histoplasma capsulatum G186AR]EEH05758.1 zinc finger protein [Histoplasma capsulatum G186AR]KAG5300079.1 zinc finger protein [Histoplasma capsulatum]QSS67292.1 zinc finger protein [Histoplasma capsulatum G186AR]